MSILPPLISVYIANHNYGRFLEQAVESVLRQTQQNFELIIIDDGSTDDSPAILERYANHEKITLIAQHNKGLSVTNNIALKTARGTYIMRLDADDFLDENALQIMSGILESNPDVALVFPDYFHVDEEGNILELVRRHDFDEVELYDQPAHGACTMVRRKCLLAMNGYDETFRCQDGWDIWIRFIERYEVRNVNLPLFFYRQHGTNLTRDERRLLDTRARILARRTAAIGRRLKALAVIPVRGPRLDAASMALEELGGKRVIDWTIDAALEAERTSWVVVTTPDPDIIEHVRARYGDGVGVIHRPPTLARPNTPIADTLIDAVERVGVERSVPELLALLYVECPFRTGQHLDTGVDVLELFGTDTVVAVLPESDDLYQHKGQGMVPLRKNSALRLERDDVFRAVGQMYVARTEFFRETGHMTGGKVGHIVFDQHAALYLRSNWDLEIARLYAKRLQDESAEGVSEPDSPSRVREA